MGDDVPPPTKGSRIKLATGCVQISALFALGLAASTVTEVFRFDIVAGVTFRVVVMDTLFDRVPR